MSRSDLDDISKKQETRTAALVKSECPQGLYQRLTQTVKAPKIKIFSN